MSASLPVVIRDLTGGDLEPLSTAFADWPKSPEHFQRYLLAAETRRIDALVAAEGDRLLGYTTIQWVSEYPPFAAEGIPEIADLNVLAASRGLGVGRMLMDEAERRIASRSRIAGIRVGLYADYGPAQRMYVRRGYVPDGSGVSVDGVTVAPGTSIVLDDEPTLAFTRSLP
jgi:GNAT superfamily N-acetyltransferase